MTTLRSLLEEYADSVPTDVPPGRIPLVHRRIRTTRRRRAAGGVAVVVALLVVGSLALTLPHPTAPVPADAPVRMAGHAVPRTTDSLGASYSYARGVVGDQTVSVTLPTSQTPLLVRAASRSSTGRLAIRSGGADAWVTPAGDFGSFYAVAPGASRRVRLQLHGGSGPVALAVYRQTAPPPGYHRGGITYPTTVAGHRLLGAVVSAAGTSRATLSLQRVGAVASVVPYCNGAPAGTRIRIRDGGGVFVEGGCDGRPGADAAHDGNAVVTRPDGTRLRIEAIDRSGRPVTAGGVRVGLGVYEATATQLRNGIADRLDQDGHRWELASRQRSSAGVSGMGHSVVDRLPVLVLWGGGGSGSTVELRVDGVSHDRSSGGGIGSLVLSTVRGRDRLEVRATGRLDRPLVLATYRLAD
ncbi:MAG: hypothetical protein ACTHNS_14570 [Marmoricola sp.]